MGFSPRIETLVDPTQKGIRHCDTVDVIESDPTEELEEDSILDENEEILALERRDFDDIDRIEFDLE